MSIFAQLSLKFLEGHVVALLMLTTPIYMFLIESFSLKKGQYLRFFITFIVVLVSIISWTVYEAFFEFEAQKNLQFSLNFKGILFTQLSNISFAVGQILLKKFFEKTTELPVICASPVLYLGATIMCMPLALSSIFIPKLTIPSMSCILSLLVFGIIFFGVAQYLWNVGITRTNIRTVSVLSNIQIPMAVIISGIVFRENVSHKTFVLALILMCMMLILGLSTHKNLIADNV
jgi:drug/metabolite transporter (DMT)-like permease